MGCCFNKEDKHNEILLIDNNSRNSVCRSKLIYKARSPNYPQNLSILKVKMSLKSNIIIPNQRKLSMGKESLNLRHKSVSYLSPLKLKMIKDSNNIKANDDNDKDFKSDDEPLNKRASLHISKFLFVFQDQLSQEKPKTFSNYFHDKKPAKKKNNYKKYQSPYEGEIDLALVYPQLPYSPVHEITTS